MFVFYAYSEVVRTQLYHEELQVLGVHLGLAAAVGGRLIRNRSQVSFSARPAGRFFFLLFYFDVFELLQD